MGNCLSFLINWMRRNKVGVETRRVTLAIVGLDDSGKTVIAKVLAGEPFDDVVPTVGFSHFEFSMADHSVSLFDLGGGPNIRAIWKNYFGEVHGLVFAVDSGNMERLSEAKSVFSSVVNDERITCKPLLILGNKQDTPDAIDESELCDRLQVEELVNRQKCLCRIVCCNAISQLNGEPDDSIFSGIHWLLDAIDSDWTNLELRVKVDMDAERMREDIDKREKAERVEQQLKEQEPMKNEEEQDEEKVGAENPFRRLDKNYFK